MEAPWRAVAGGLVLALLLGGCAPGAPDGPRRPAGVFGGSLTLALDRDPGSLDPAHGVDAAAAQVMAALYDGLVRAGRDGRVEPALARRWQVSSDGRVYRFYLREGVRFHNGSELTAEDVVFSFRRLLDPAVGSPRAWVLADLEGALAFRSGMATDVAGLRAAGPYAVELVLSRPSATLLQRLAMPAAYVLDRETAGAAQGEWLPVGTGPFRLVSWRPGEELLLSAHEAYFAGRPYLDALRFRVDLDREGVVRELARGGLGAADLTGGEHRLLAERLRWAGPAERGVRPAVYYLALNNQRPPLTDATVRQAIYRAIDREALLDGLLGHGNYVLANGSIPPGVPGHDPQRRGLPYDPLQAKQLLAQAGLAGGLELTLVETGTPGVHALNLQLAEMLGRVGIRVRLRTVDRDTFDRVVSAGEADAFVLAWWADYLDPEDFLLPLFHTSSFGAAGNRARFGSAETDRALEELLRATSPRARELLARRVEDLVFARVPWVPLFFPVRYFVHQPGLHGLEPPVLAHGESYWDVWWEEPR